ncbi:Gpi16 subunit GPI transamidase component [Phanerochaete sordida]|uniref:Gpi16 subunit GPI transamidase component n=1 Tax=Phanerochaete sordida TaxID=48140 RepID=A0A9P3GCX9_9APHY|nr:Gpi16 subunit GPI transamidase component [Phanerochaete sordida]
MIETLPLSLLLLLVCSICSAKESFSERLVLSPNLDGTVTASFAFTTLLEGARPRDPAALAEEDDSQHYTLFPLALGQILRDNAITELHLTLNAGKWDYQNWGYPEEEGVGTGAELWAWMGEGAVQTADERWKNLRNALAGLFCASIGSLDEQRTTSPALTFQPEGDLPLSSTTHALRHGTLPSERVCTENLTPFLKLLPCKARSGIATLLNPHRLFDADWHGMGVHVRYLEGAGIEVRLAFQAVLNPVRYSGDKKRDWSMTSLFDRSIERSCPVASSSEIAVRVPPAGGAITEPAPLARHAGFAVYDVKHVDKPIDVGMRWPEETQFEYSLDAPQSALMIRRRLSGSDQYKGQLSVVLTNKAPHEVKTSYLETMPWLLQFYLHSLRVVCDGIPRDDLVSIVSYTPPVPHARPSLLQAVLTLPANSTVQLTMDVVKPFLRYTEHPPDAQRGWDLPPAVFVPLGANATGAARLRRVYTPVLLVDLATPDFSMPYNVIIMSCTLIALVFGGVFNLLTRKFVVVALAPAAPADT